MTLETPEATPLLDPSVVAKYGYPVDAAPSGEAQTALLDPEVVSRYGTPADAGVTVPRIEAPVPDLEEGTSARLSKAMLYAIDTHPSEASQALRAAQLIGVPPELALLDPKAAARKVAEAGWDPEALLRKSPHTAELFTDPMVMAAARKDLPFFQKLEDNYRLEREGAPLPSMKAPGAWGDLPREVGAGFMDAFAAETTGAGYVLGVLAGQTERTASDAVDPATTLRQVGAITQNMANNIRPPENRRSWVNDVVGAIGYLGGMAAGAAVLGASAVPVLLTTMAVGSVESSMAAQGVDTMNSRRAQMSVAAAAVAMGWLDNIGLSAVLGKYLPALSQKAGVRAFAARTGKAFFGETWTEGTQQVAQNLAERNVGLNTDRSVFDGSIYAGLTGGSAGALFSAVLSGKRAMRMSPNAEATNAQLRESLTRDVSWAQSPDGARARKELTPVLLKHLQQMEGEKEIYFSPQPLREFLAALPEDVRTDISAKVPMLGEQLADPDAPVAIRRMDWQMYLASQAGSEGLIQHVKYAPLDLTAAEAELVRQSQEAFDAVIQATQDAEAAADADALALAKGAGLSKESTDQLAALLPMRRNIARRIGINAETLNPSFTLQTPKGEATLGEAPVPTPQAAPVVDPARSAALENALAKVMSMRAGLSQPGVDQAEVARNTLAAALAGKGALPREVQAAARDLGIKPSRKAIQEYLNTAPKEDAQLLFESYGQESGIALEEAQAQLAAVQDVRDGQGRLLAPNGRPSKLNERLWRVVRTPAFKVWFGDWENDPENASKVVDENGEPLVVYHGTGGDFDAFKGDAVMFSPRSDVANIFAGMRPIGGNVMPVFLNVRNPKYTESQSLAEGIAYWGEPAEKQEGFDGLIYSKAGNILKGASGWGNDIPQYAVFSPAQIKSISNRGTFDPQDARILFQQETTADLGSDIKATTRGYLARGDAELNRVVLALTKHAGATTLAHEMGHYGSFLLRKAAGLAQAQLDSGQINQGVTEADLRQVIADWETLRAWATGDANSTATELDTKAEERIADGFLVYLQTGKAPTRKLVGIFTKFRLALFNIIRGEFLQKGAPLSEEVKDVYARWLISDTDVANATMAPFDLINSVASLFGVEVSSKVGQLLNRGGAHALSDHYAAYVRDEVGRQNAEYQVVLEDRRRARAAEAAQDPRFALIQYVQDDVRMDLALIKQEFPDLDTRDIPAVFLGGAASSDYVAATFRRNGEAPYATGFDVIQALMAGEIDVDAWVEKQAKADVDKVFPGMRDLGKAEEMAARVMQNEDVSKAVEALLIAAGEKRATLQVVKRMAAARVATMAVKGLRPDRHVAARDAAMREAMRKGTIKKGGDAAVLLWEAMVHNEMATAMTDAKTEASKYQASWNAVILKDYTRHNRVDRKLVAKYDIPILDVARQFLARAGIGDAKPLPEGATLADEVWRLLPESELSYLETAIEVAEAPAIPANEMSLTDLRRFARAVDSIAAVSKGMRRAADDARAIKDGLVAEQVKRGHQYDKDKALKQYGMSAAETLKLKERLRYATGLRHLGNTLTRLEHFFTAMGYPEVFAKAQNAHAAAHLAMKNAKFSWQKVFTSDGVDWKKKLNIDTREAWIPGMETVRTAASRMPVIRTTNELVTLLANTGSNFRHICEGYGWDPDATKALIARLEETGVIQEAHWRCVQRIWRVFADIKGAVYATELQEIGATPDDVEVTPVSTKWGVLEGGYVPLTYDPDFDKAALARSARELDSMQYLQDQASLSNDPGFGKSRTNYAAPLALAVENLAHKHLEMIKYVHLSPTITHLHRVFQRPDVREAVGFYDPRIIPDMVVPWLAATRRTVSGKPSNERVLDPVFRFLTRTAGAAYMALNVPNAASQLTDLTAVVPYTSEKALMSATAQVTRHPIEMTTRALNASVVMQARGDFHIVSDTGSIQNIVAGRGKLAKVREAAFEHAYILQRHVQWAADVTAWTAGYAHATEVRGLTGQAAVDYADSVVTRAFGDTSAVGRAAFFNDASPLMRLFLQFGDWPNNKANAVVWGIIGELRRDGTSYEKARVIASLVAYQAMLPLVLGSMVMLALGGRWPTDEDDDDTVLDDVTATVALDSLSAASMAIPFAATMVKALSADSKFGQPALFAPPIAGLASQMVAGAKEIGSEDADLSTMAKGLSVALALGFAPQAYALYKPLNAWIDIAEGDRRTPETTQEWLAFFTRGQAPR